MAQLSMDVDIDKMFPKALSDEKMSLDMVKSGQEIMQKAIQNSAMKHKKTGSMASSVKSAKPTVNRDGDVVGRVKFYGKDENGMLNNTKARWIEFGTKNMHADPFVRPAIKGCENGVKTAMQKVFDSKVK